MTEIIDYINDVFSDSQVCNGVNVNGICKLVLKNDQPHPVSVLDDKQVAPNDRYDGIIYHRILNDAITDDPDNSFGDTIEKRHAQQVRTVVIVKRQNGEGWIDQLINLIPRNIDGIEDYKLVDIGGIAKNTDQPVIFNTEFGENSYEKHRIPYMIYALEYNIEYIRC